MEYDLVMTVGSLFTVRCCTVIVPYLGPILRKCNYSFIIRLISMLLLGFFNLILQVERFNHTQNYVEETFSNIWWDRFLPGVLLAYCNTPHESTRETVFPLILNRKKLIPIGIEYPIKTG